MKLKLMEQVEGNYGNYLQLNFPKIKVHSLWGKKIERGT